MSDRDRRQVEVFETQNISDFFRESKGSRREYTITAKPFIAASGEVIWLHVLATYKLGANGYQESYGYAWTTGADGTTPQNVERLSIQIEVAGELSPPDPLTFQNTNKVGTATRGVYSSVPQRVTAYAVSEGPHIEASDTSDD